MSSVRTAQNKIGAVAGVQPSATESTRSLGPGGSSNRSLPPTSGSAMSAATSSHSAMAPSAGNGGKRFQLVQALASSVGHSVGPDDRIGMLQHKVDQVFGQIETMTAQQLIDRRPGTTQIFTLPEFFWNDHGAHITEQDAGDLIRMLQDKVANADYQNAVFVLGTVVTSEAPPHMARLDHHDFPAFAEQLGHSVSNLERALHEAMSQDAESFGDAPSPARIDLTATASLAAELVLKGGGGNDGPLPAATLLEAAKDIKVIKANEEAMAILVGFSGSRELNAHFDDFVNANGMEETKAVLDRMAHDADLYIDEHQITQLKDLANKYAGKKSEFIDLAKAYKKHYLPFKVADSRLIQRRIPALLLRRNPALGILRQGRNANLTNLHERGRLMFKGLRNQAIVLDGGSRQAPRLIQKFAPSDADVPSYNPAKAGSKGDPPQHHSFRHVFGNTAPSMSDTMLSERLIDAGHNSQAQVYQMPHNGAEMGLVICKDIETAHFRDFVSDRVSHAEVFQLISAGITAPKFRAQAPQGPLQSQNDGTDVFSQVLRGPLQQPVAQNIYEQPSANAGFELRPAAPQPALNAGDRGAWAVSGTVHRPGAADSEAGSLTDNRAGGDRAAFQERANHYEKEIGNITKKLHDLETKGTDEVRLHGTEALTYLKGLNLPISADLAHAWQDGQIENDAFLGAVREVLDGELTATTQMRDNELAKMDAVRDRSDS